MTETRRRTGGRAGRQAARAAAQVERVPFLTRTLTPLEVLSEEGLSLLEENADRILEEVGIEFHGAPDALELFAGAGASVDGERVRFPRGLCRSLVQATAPREFTQVARNRGERRRLRRAGNDLRPRLRLAVRARPRRRQAVRDDRGLPRTS